MIHNELQTIKESIERIEKFQENFPKKIVCNDVRWQKFFDWEYELCVSQAKALGLSTDEFSMKNTVLDL